MRGGLRRPLQNAMLKAIRETRVRDWIVVSHSCDYIGALLNSIRLVP